MNFSSKIKKGAFLGLVLLLSSVCVGQTVLDNWSGWYHRDTVESFRADSVWLSSVMPLARYEASVVTVMLDDTGSAGAASDSIVVEWGIQTGHEVLDSADGRDTLWGQFILVMDTCDAGGTVGPSDAVVGADGSYSHVTKTIDTSSVAGYICQSRQIVPNSDQFLRVRLEGLTGNNGDSFLVGRVQVSSRVAQKVSR